MGCDGKREEDEDVFKKKLIIWLKENNLKLAASNMGDLEPPHVNE